MTTVYVAQSGINVNLGVRMRLHPLKSLQSGVLHLSLWSFLVTVLRRSIHIKMSSQLKSTQSTKAFGSSRLSAAYHTLYRVLLVTCWPLSFLLWLTVKEGGAQFRGDSQGCGCLCFLMDTMFHIVYISFRRMCLRKTTSRFSPFCWNLSALTLGGRTVVWI